MEVGNELEVQYYWESIKWTVLDAIELVTEG